MDHNKQSGNDPIEVRYKTEVEEILDGNRPSIVPKLLDSNLNLDDFDNEEKEMPIDEITGRNKRKNESESIEQENPRKANKSEVRQVKNLLENFMHQKMEDEEYKREERKKREIERKKREEQRQQEISLLISALYPTNTSMMLPQNNGM
jgi:hypothetical protein